MSLYDRSNPLVRKSGQNKLEKNKSIEKINDIKKGNLIGATKSIIKVFIYKFNLFNKQSNFELRLEEPDIRRYNGGNVTYPADLIYISSFSEKDYSPRFIQFFLPIKSIYTVLDHIYSGEFSCEYNRSLSKIDLRMLEWYFSFFDKYKEPDYPLLYDVFLDINGAFPIDQLFSGLNLIIGYIPVSLNNIIFSEAVIRVNLKALEKVVNNIYEKNKGIYSLDKREKNETNVFSVNRKATDNELDDIIKQIIRQ
jgi:hypothetical protein